MRHPIRRFVLAVAVLVAIAVALYAQHDRLSILLSEARAPELPAAVGYEEVGQEGTGSQAAGAQEELPVSVPEPVPEPVPVAETGIPDSFNLAVPFTSQAPFANWDALHEDACEEASVYMVSEYYKGVSGVIPAQTAEDELQRLVAMEYELFGRFESTTALETSQLVAKAYGLRAEMEFNPTVETIKNHVVAGRPVIIPAAGQMLGNPNFTGDGPPYHMLVVRGYADGMFITNDPGTRRGEQYVYDEDVLMDAIHDWTGSYETITTGQKVILVVYPD